MTGVSIGSSDHYSRERSSCTTSRALTLPSRGRSKGRFAPFGPPLMSNVRPPERARRGMLSQDHPKSKQWSNCTRSVSRRIPRLAPVLGNRGCASARRVPSGGRQSELRCRRAPVSKFERGGRPCAYVREIQGRSAWGVRPAAATARIVKHEGPLEGTTHARPAQQMQLRVAAFVRVAHTVAHMNARTDTNGYGTVSTHARPTHMLFNQRPNPSIDGTSNSQLRCLSAAPHVKR